VSDVGSDRFGNTLRFFLQNVRATKIGKNSESKEISATVEKKLLK
jgi:hypothetical protein